MVRHVKQHSPKGGIHSEEKSMMQRASPSTSFRCLFGCVVLVVIVSLLCMRKQEAGSESSNSPQSKETKIRGSRSGVSGGGGAAAAGTSYPPPTASPTHHEIEVKSHEEVHEHLQQSQGKPPPSHFYTEGMAPLMYKHIRYRFPSQSFHNFSAYDKGVVVGVLSTPEHVSRRDVIRKTWAYHHSNVFFVVEGPWEHISEEIKYQKDIFWVDIPQGPPQNMVLKSQTFVIAAMSSLDFSFILKTNDDSYVRLADIEKLVAKSTSSSSNTPHEAESLPSGDSDNKNDGDKNDDGAERRRRRTEENIVPSDSVSENDVQSDASVLDTQDFDWASSDYIGSCVGGGGGDDNNNGLVVSGGTPQFPTFALGTGYLISKNFTQCFVHVAELAPILSTMEDATVGLYAEICHVHCQHSDRFLEIPPAGPTTISSSSETNYVVAHPVDPATSSDFVEQILITLHTQSCSRADADAADPNACAEGSLRNTQDVGENGVDGGEGGGNEGGGSGGDGGNDNDGDDNDDNDNDDD